MDIQITSQQQINPQQVEQVIKFYLVRLTDHSRRLAIDLKRIDQSQGRDQFRVHLCATQKDGGKLEFFEIQHDLIHATQRSLDRLVRHQLLQRKHQPENLASLAR